MCYNRSVETGRGTAELLRLAEQVYGQVGVRVRLQRPTKPLWKNGRGGSRTWDERRKSNTVLVENVCRELVAGQNIKTIAAKYGWTVWQVHGKLAQYRTRRNLPNLYAVVAKLTREGRIPE